MSEKKQLTEKDSGGSIELHTQDTLAVSLPENPTSGFRWEIDRVDSQVLHPAGEPVFEPSSNLVGGGGVTTFQFQGAQAGSTALRLVYRRSFEKNVPPASTFELNVRVSG